MWDLGISQYTTLEVKGVYWEIPKSHISCLNPWSTAYISVGQLHLISIGFKMKSNMVSEQVLTLGSFRCDEHPPFVVHAPSPISAGREGDVLENTQVPHQLQLIYLTRVDMLRTYHELLINLEQLISNFHR